MCINITGLKKNQKGMVLFCKFYCGLHTKTNLQLNDKKKYKGMCSEFMHTDKKFKRKIADMIEIH